MKYLEIFGKHLRKITKYQENPDKMAKFQKFKLKINWRNKIRTKNKMWSSKKNYENYEFFKFWKF